jgi:TRAP-type transport system periplasmic protein
VKEEAGSRMARSACRGGAGRPAGATRVAARAGGLVLGAGLALAAIFGSERGAAAAPPDPIRMSFGSIAPEGTPWAEEMKGIKARVEKESGGRMKVSLFLGGRRGNENEMLAEVRRGKLQAVGLSSGSLAMEVPELQCLEFPFLFRDGEEVDAVLEGPIGNKLVKKAEERGIILAVWGENGWRSIATRSKQVVKPEDVKDLRVRAQESQINVAFWKALDAAPTRIPLNEVLSALKTNVVDGYDQTPLYMSAAEWHKEIQYFTLTEHTYQGAAIIYNKAFLDSLPEDLRKIVLTDTEETGRRNRKAVRKMGHELLQEFRDAKIQVRELTEEERAPWRERTKKVYAQFENTEAGALVREIEAQLGAMRAKKPEKGSGGVGASGGR